MELDNIRSLSAHVGFCIRTYEYQLSEVVNSKQLSYFTGFPTVRVRRHLHVSEIKLVVSTLKELRGGG